MSRNKQKALCAADFSFQIDPNPATCRSRQPALTLALYSTPPAYRSGAAAWVPCVPPSNTPEMPAVLPMTLHCTSATSPVPTPPSPNPLPFASPPSLPYNTSRSPSTSPSTVDRFHSLASQPKYPASSSSTRFSITTLAHPHPRPR